MATANNVNFDWSYFDAAATPENYLNRGAFGTVYGPIEYGNELYALKQILFGRGDLNEKAKTTIHDKKDIWMALKHENLIRIHDVGLRPNALLIVMDYAAGGSLYTTLSALTSESKLLPLEVVLDWAKQIVKGMVYLHERNVVHRDLKSANIMVMKRVDPNDLLSQVTLKIADFDEVKEITNTTKMSFRGTLPWMAPEVLEDEKFSKASDVYSFGVVLSELLTGCVPYKDKEVTRRKLVTRELRLILPETVPEAYKELFSACTNVDRDERPSFHIIEAWCHGNRQVILGDKVYSKHPSLICTIKTKVAKEEDVAVRGVTGLKEEVFVISESSCEVEAYYLVTLEYKRFFLINGLRTPLDIKSCPLKNFLVILDCIEMGVPNKIFVTDVQGNVKYNWEVGDSEARLSVAVSGNIILSLGNLRKIVEYKCNGTEVRVIDLGFILPRHAILQENNKFLISHGRVNDDEDFLHRVFQLIVKDDENDKTIVKAYGGDKGAAPGAMNIPWYLAIDENDYIFVAEKENQRVILLSPRLKFRRVLICDDLRQPLNMWMDVPNGRLFITDFKVVDNKRTDGRLLVFQIRQCIANCVPRHTSVPCEISGVPREKPNIR